MSYENNESKFVAVLNRRHPLPVRLNALGHVTAGLAGGMGRAEAMAFQDYRNDGARMAARLSLYPFIVLSAKNSGQLRSLHGEAVGRGIAVNPFTTTMLGTSAEEQIVRTAEAEPEALDYVAVTLFGRAEELDPLTRKFSLFKPEEGG